MAYESRSDVHSRGRRKKGRFLRYFFITLLTLITIAALVVGFFYFRLRASFEQFQNKEVVEKIEKVREETVAIGKDPISILVLGIDTGEYERTEVGRSDIMMVVTINPETKKATMTSIPRDTYAEIVGHGDFDKINHAYAFGGVSMSVNSVQKLLDIPIDYFLSIDMGGFTRIVDQLGGLTITPIETFEQEGFFFEEGVTQNMDGATALQYIRNRFLDSGDYGRQERSRQVLSALAQKAVSLNSVTSLPSMLGILEDNVETNITFDEIQSLIGDAVQISKNLEILPLSGSGETIDGIYYEKLDEKILSEIVAKMKANLDIQ